MFVDFVYRHPKKAVAAALLLAGAIAGLAWWHLVWQSPQNVFVAMLSNNLSTSSVTKHQIGGTSSQTIDQYVRMQLGSPNASDWLVTIKQNGGSSVTTETIGTPEASYVRYVRVSTAQQKRAGQKDFSSILNIWGKASTSSGSSLTGLFNRSVLDVSTAPMPPIGNVPAEKKAILLRYIAKEQVIVPDYKTVKTASYDGRKAYVYTVAVKLAPYVLVMQAFAKDLGLHDLDSVDATQYSRIKPVSLQFTVDASSRHLVKAVYTAASYSETYSDYGLAKPITVPAQSIPIGQLETRLQKLL